MPSIFVINQLGKIAWRQKFFFFCAVGIHSTIIEERVTIAVFNYLLYRHCTFGMAKNIQRRQKIKKGLYFDLESVNGGYLGLKSRYLFFTMFASANVEFFSSLGIWTACRCTYKSHWLELAHKDSHINLFD